jgi:YbbR domain-containing protein
VLESVRANFGLRVVALVLATGAWCFLRFGPNAVAARFDQQLNVPITITGLRPGLVARAPEKQVLVTIIPPRGMAAPVKPDDVKAVVDLADRDVGVHNVPVQVIAEKLEIKALSPASVTLALERVEEREFPVEVEYVGDRHGLIVDEVHVSPWRAVARGATGDLVRIAAVRVEVPFAEGQFDEMVKPLSVDRGGKTIDAVTLAPSLVRVSAHFEKPEH